MLCCFYFKVISLVKQEYTAVVLVEIKNVVRDETQHPITFHDLLISPSSLY